MNLYLGYLICFSRDNCILLGDIFDDLIGGLYWNVDYEFRTACSCNLLNLLECCVERGKLFLVII